MSGRDYPASDDHVDAAREAMQRPTTIHQIGTTGVYGVRCDGKQIGMINARRARGSRPHAMGGASRVHYADTIEECVAWLTERAS